MMNRTNTILAIALAMVVVMIVVAQVDYSKPNIEILPDMKYSPAWDAYSSNPNFPNRRTLQSPLDGTIARGTMPLDYTPSKEDAIRAGEELSNPFSVAEEDAEGLARLANSIARGGEIYRRFCISCHGREGAGDGPVTQRGFPPPPSMLSGKSRDMKDGQLFHILTYGQGTMTPFAAQLDRDGRWDVINYVRDVQSRSPVEPAAEDPVPTEAAQKESSNNDQ